MSGAEIGLAISVFLACAVEAVEALTIVLAVGITRSWSSAMFGVGTAGVALAAVVAALGPTLTLLPLNALRLVVGGLLLIFGLQWLRKAILRSTGLKAKHDEIEAYNEELTAARAVGGGASGFDGYAFTIAFKGVLLEGLEVVFIVLTFGANQHRVGLAAIAAAIAVLLVILAGAAVKGPLATVPENTLKFAVGVMLSSFGIFWGAEGAGASWPGGDGALLVIVPVVLLAAIAMVQILRATLRRTRPVIISTIPTPPEEVEVAEEIPNSRQLAPVAGGSHPLVGERPTTQRRSPLQIITSIFMAIWNFIVGDDWRTALAVVLALGITALVDVAGVAAWWVLPPIVLGVLAYSVWRVLRILREHVSLSKLS